MWLRFSGAQGLRAIGRVRWGTEIFRAPKSELKWTETDGVPFSAEREQNISMKALLHRRQWLQTISKPS